MATEFVKAEVADSHEELAPKKLAALAYNSASASNDVLASNQYATLADIEDDDDDLKGGVKLPIDPVHLDDDEDDEPTPL
jgi:hypothetical protein